MTENLSNGRSLSPSPSSSLAAKGFRSVRPNLHQKFSIQVNGAGGQNSFSHIPVSPWSTSPSSVLSSHLSSPSLSHNRSNGEFNGQEIISRPSTSPLDQTGTSTVVRWPKDWYKSMFKEIHLVNKAGNPDIPRSTSDHGLQSHALRHRQPPDLGYTQTEMKEQEHPDRKVNTQPFRVEPGSIFDYKPGGSSGLEQEGQPPKKCLDEILHKSPPSSPVQTFLHLHTTHGPTHSPASDYRKRRKSEPVTSVLTSSLGAHHSSASSLSSNQGLIWPTDSAPISLSLKDQNCSSSQSQAELRSHTHLRRPSAYDKENPAATALYDFKAQTIKELSLRKGNTVQILHTIDNNWYEVEHNGRVGIVPISYLLKIPVSDRSKPFRPLPPGPTNKVLGEAVARYSFAADTSVELSLRRGQRVLVLRQVDQNWYEGCIPESSKQGIFPVSYVEMSTQPHWLLPLLPLSISNDGIDMDVSSQSSPSMNPRFSSSSPLPSLCGCSSSSSSSSQRAQMQNITNDWFSLTLGLPSPSSISSTPAPTPPPLSFTPTPIPPSLSISSSFTPGPTPSPYPYGLLAELQELDSLVSPSPCTLSTSLSPFLPNAFTLSRSPSVSLSCSPSALSSFSPTRSQCFQDGHFIPISSSKSYTSFPSSPELSLSPLPSFPSLSTSSPSIDSSILCGSVVDLSQASTKPSFLLECPNVASSPTSLEAFHLAVYEPSEPATHLDSNKSNTIAPQPIQDALSRDQEEELCEEVVSIIQGSQLQGPFSLVEDVPRLFIEEMEGLEDFPTLHTFSPESTEPLIMHQQEEVVEGHKEPGIRHQQAVKCFTQPRNHVKILKEPIRKNLVENQNPVELQSDLPKPVETLVGLQVERPKLLEPQIELQTLVDHQNPVESHLESHVEHQNLKCKPNTFTSATLTPAIPSSLRSSLPSYPKSTLTSPLSPPPASASPLLRGHSEIRSHRSKTLQREVLLVGKPPRSPILSRRSCSSPLRYTHSPLSRQPAFSQEGLQCGGEPFQVLYYYAPRCEDELELREGDVIDVMERCDDGWFVGTSRRSRFFGTFPGNYVRRI